MNKPAAHSTAGSLVAVATYAGAVDLGRHIDALDVLAANELELRGLLERSPSAIFGSSDGTFAKFATSP